MHSWDMLVESPVCEADLVDRNRKPDHDQQNQCSYCGKKPGDPWYDVRDVMVVRHWKSTSQDVPAGGHWTWYCPEHFAGRNGNWWRSSHSAPERLKPKMDVPCVTRIEFGERCGVDSVEPFDGASMCGKHAAAERVNRRAREIFDVRDPFDED